MPRETRSTITADAQLIDDLNAARQEREDTWDAFLRAALEAVETPTDAMDLTPGAIDDLSARLTRDLANEIQARLR